jgi:hypothetical protein
MPRNNSGRPRTSAPLISSPANAQRRSSSQALQQNRPSPDTNPRTIVPSSLAQPSNAGGVGILGSIASTAAGVAIGHSIGNAITGIFGSEGISSPNSSDNSAADTNVSNEPCGFLMKQFTQCLETNTDAAQCKWIFEQVTLCQRSSMEAGR